MFHKQYKLYQGAVNQYTALFFRVDRKLYKSQEVQTDRTDVYRIYAVYSMDNV